MLKQTSALSRLKPTLNATEGQIKIMEHRTFIVSKLIYVNAATFELLRNQPTEIKIFLNYKVNIAPLNVRQQSLKSGNYLLCITLLLCTTKRTYSLYRVLVFVGNAGSSQLAELVRLLKRARFFVNTKFRSGLEI